MPRLDDPTQHQFVLNCNGFDCWYCGKSEADHRPLEVTVSPKPTTRTGIDSEGLITEHATIREHRRYIKEFIEQQ